MNHKNTTLVIATIVAAVALTAVTFVIPQQASTSDEVFRIEFVFIFQ